MLSFRTVDDRGHPVRMPAAFASVLWNAWRRRWSGWTLRSIPVRVLRLVLSGPMLVLAGATALVVLGVLVTFDDPGIGLWLLIFSPVYSSLFMFAFALVRGVMGWGGVLSDQVRQSMLHAHRCPACGYNLRGTLAEDDGCLVCAECGAAWDAAHLGAMHAREGSVVVLTGWAKPPGDARE